MIMIISMFIIMITTTS